MCMRVCVRAKGQPKQLLSTIPMLFSTLPAPIQGPDRGGAMAAGALPGKGGCISKHPSGAERYGLTMFGIDCFFSI